MKDFNNTFGKIMEQYQESTDSSQQDLEILIKDMHGLLKNPKTKLTYDQKIAKLKNYISQLNDTPENRRDMEYLAGGEEPVMESKKKTKKDACYHKAKAKYDVFPSAYASGYISKCRKRKGKIK
jgi:hypothetical protein